MLQIPLRGPGQIGWPYRFALVRLDERIERSPVGEGGIERMHFADACASLWTEGELVAIEDLVLHEVSHDARTPTHELTTAPDILKTRRRKR